MQQQFDTRDRDGAVMTCAATDCAFNRQFACMAPWVNVGRGCACCDTYTRGPVQAASTQSFVLACMTTSASSTGTDGAWLAA